MISNQDHNYDDQNSCFSSTTQVTPIKATIIYFPSPFLHSCKNVPASTNTNTTTDKDKDTAIAATLTSMARIKREHKKSHSYKERRIFRERQQVNNCKFLQDTSSSAAAAAATNHLNDELMGVLNTRTVKSSSEEQTQCDLNIIGGNDNKYYYYHHDRCNSGDVDRILKTNSRLADSSSSIKLRNYSQLVMPIGDSSRLGGGIDVNNETNRMMMTSTHQHYNKNTNNIISQTTTLDCRCFMDNSDMLIASKIDANRNDDADADAANYDCNNSSECNNNKINKDDICSRTTNKNNKNNKLFPIRTLLSVVHLWSHQHLISSCRRRISQLLRKSSTAADIITMYRLLLTLAVMLIFTSTVSCWAGRQDVLSNCTFPARWEGSWFLSGYQQSIHIKGSQFSYRGKCAATDGNKYLIVDEKGCHRCLVIYEKHKNVLQYKESECEGDSMYMHQSNPSAMAMRSVLKQNGGDHRGGAHPNTNGHSRLSSSDQYIMRSNDDMNDYFCKGRETLQNLCDQIPGDALLYSLFRESAEPVKCPLKGPFVFTYNRGHGECKSPVSNIESCTEDSRLLLSFQACPDVQGTESTVEELTCLANWKDGNSRYLVGLVSHHHAISNEERYRCFVYEKITSLMGGPGIVSAKDAEYKLAQSGDATCNGLDSAEVGSRIMSLRKPPVAVRCDFPSWFKGPGHWHALMGNAVYNYHKNGDSVHIIKSNGYMETRALCEQINKQTSTEMMAVVHYTTGCQSGFMCMMFYRRDTHIIEIQTGKQASRLEDACAPDHFDINKMPYITLLASDPDQQICPLEGMYNLRGAIGPPYLTTRHKRNHNNKLHGVHGHHHQSNDMNDGSNNNGHKRHNTMSFRNMDRIERGIWHASTRGLTVRSNRNRRDAPGCVTNYKAQRQLLIGCSGPDIIDVRPLCSEDGEEEYSCHGSWTENSTVYIIARHKQTKHGVCISYRVTEGNSAKLVIGDACYRGALKPPEHHLVSNLSVFGKCGDTSSRSTNMKNNGWLAILAVAILTTLVHHRADAVAPLNHR